MSFKIARQTAELSAKEVAEKLGVSDVCVYMWEAGEWNPRASKLPELAELYGCTVDELLKKE